MVVLYPDPDPTTDAWTLDHHQPVSCQQLLDLHAMIWQQQPCKAVLQHLSSEDSSSPPTSSSPSSPSSALLSGSPALFSLAVQDAVLAVICSPLCQTAPCSTRYLARLVKQLIIAAEDEGQELGEELLQLHTALLMQGGNKAGEEEDASWRYKTFYYSRDPSWDQLQQLEQEQCTAILAAVSTSRRCEDTVGGWRLPAHLQQCLQQLQQARQQLLATAELQHLHLLLPSLPKLQHEQQQPQQAGQDSIQRDGQHLAGNKECTAGSFAAAAGGLKHNSRSSSSSCGLITIYSSDNMFEGGTGCHMWDAGFLLAEFVLNRRQLFAGKRVLEIGCGPGLVATCLCRVEASRVLLTDGDPQTLVNCLSNLGLNGHSSAALLGSWQEARQLLQDHQQQQERQQHQQQQEQEDGHDYDCQTMQQETQRLQQQQQQHSCGAEAGQQEAQHLQQAVQQQLSRQLFEPELGLSGDQHGNGLSSQGEKTSREANMSAQVLACPLDWHEEIPGLDVDVIVGSDICYDPEAVPSLVQLLQQLLGASNNGSQSHSQQHNPSSSASHVAVDEADAEADPAVDGSSGCIPAMLTQHNSTAREAHGPTPASLSVSSSASRPGKLGCRSISAAAGAVCAYIATTKRHPSTLQLFRDLAAEAGLEVTDLCADPQDWLSNTSCCSNCSHCSYDRRRRGSGGCTESIDDGGVDVGAAACRCTAAASTFQMLPALQDGEGRERYVLHRVTKRLTRLS